MLKTLPSSIEAEQSVIGGIISSRGATEGFHKAIDMLSAEKFYLATNAKIFSNILDLFNAERPIEIQSISDGLDADEMETLATIIKNTAGHANLAYYAKVVFEKAYERDLHGKLVMASNVVIDEGEHQSKIDSAMSLISDVDETVSDNSQYVGSMMDDYIDGLTERFNSGGGIIGLATGFNDLDDKLQGLRGGDLVIVAGRPSMGKTVMAMNIAANCAIDGGHIKVFSMEMPKMQLVERLVASCGRVELKKLRNGQLADEDWGKHNVGFNQAHSMNINIDDRGGLNIHQIKASARKTHRKKKLDMIAIDYIQLMAGSSGNANRVTEITEITTGLKALAKELDIPIIALSQLSRKVEERPNKRPLMSDLRDSGSIGQDADIVIMMYRDEYYNEDSKFAGIAEANIVKNRAGENGKTYLASNLHYVRFDNFYGVIPEDSPLAPPSKKSKAW